MSCHDIEPLIIDFARGAKSDRVDEEALNRHLLGCPSCTGLIEGNGSLRRYCGLPLNRPSVFVVCAKPVY